MAVYVDKSELRYKVLSKKETGHYSGTDINGIHYICSGTEGVQTRCSSNMFI